MIRSLTIATVVTGLAASAQIASAGVYASLGIGSTNVSDSNTTNPFTENSRSLRGAGGLSFTKYLSAEVGVMGFDLEHQDIAYTGRELYAAGLVHLPIGNGIGGFGRLGIQHTVFDTDNANHSDLSGNGYLYGGGFEYTLPTPVLDLKLWVDYTHNDSELTAPSSTTQREVGTSMWTLGATIGF